MIIAALVLSASADTGPRYSPPVPSYNPPVPSYNAPAPAPVVTIAGCVVESK